MPSERINALIEEVHTPRSPGVTGVTPYRPGETVPHGSYINALPTLHVRWVNDAHIQIDMRMQTEYLFRIVDRIRADVAAGEYELSHETDIPTPTLTRQEMQNLIRTARRARNAVYGGDE